MHLNVEFSKNKQLLGTYYLQTLLMGLAKGEGLARRSLPLNCSFLLEKKELDLNGPA